MRHNEFGQPIGDAIDWHGARMPEPVTLTGRTVTLVPMTEEHAGAVVEALGGDVALWTYQLEDAPPDAATARESIARFNATANLQPFAIMADGNLRGRANLMRTDPAMGTIEVGSIIHGPGLQRTVGATEAQYLLMAHAFDELGHRRYEWKCDSLNAPSRRAAARLGFVEEGTWRNAVVLKGRTRDTTWFSITDGEWPLVGAALRAWLDPANFDDAGQQRRGLAEVRDSLGG